MPVLVSKLAPPACVAAAILCLWFWGTGPKQHLHFGDDQEYLTLATSFMRHQSPELEPGDVEVTLAAIRPSWQRSLTKKFPPGSAPYAYFLAKNGKYYAYHFFTYPAAVAPVRGLLEGGPHATRSHQYFNLIALSLALLSLLLIAALPVFWVMLPLASLTPVLWFSPYASTEAFVFSLCIASAACYLSCRGVLAVLCMSIAATQYQPLALLALFLFVKWVWTRRGSLRRQPLQLLAPAASAALVFAPSVFYYVHFGVPNLIAREGLVGARFATFQKFVGLFIDLNGGLAFYAPAVTLFSIVAAVWALARARCNPWGVALLVTVLLTMAGSTVQRNWNHPTFGISRYALYGIAPALMFIGGELRERNIDWRALVGLLAVALGLQALVHHENGWIEYHANDAAHHSRLARYVLERWPSLYAPHSEIFCERTAAKCSPDLQTGETASENLPVIYIDSQLRPRKILARCDETSIIRARLWSLEQRAHIRDAMQRCRGSGPIYIDF